MGAIFVAERYIELGYEVVFRQTHEYPTPDLTIKTADDKEILKNIEVKRIRSESPSKTASNIKKAFKQANIVALDFSLHNKERGTIIARKGFDEAKRKNHIKGTVEVWYNDGTMEVLV